MKSIHVIVFIIFQVNCLDSWQSCECGQRNEFRQKRIVGGKILETNKYPWTVAILDRNRNNELLCGGTLISAQHVLTAAHCVFRRKPNEISLKIGSVRLNESKDIYDISAIKCHHRYSEEMQDFDIALLTFKNALNYAFNRPICLSQSFYSNKTTKALIAGWGKTGFYSDEHFNEIREAEVTVAAHDECRNKLKEEGIQLTDRILCAANLFGSGDTCQGDSGAPLMRVEPKSGKYYAIGLSSFGIGCGKVGYYAVYTKVDYFIDWIITTIGIENMTCQHIITT